MKISELARATGVAVATIKYYVREGLLAPGTKTSATQASYGDDHVRRLRLIRALRDGAGLSVERVGEIVRLIDAPLHPITPTTLINALGAALAALPPDVDEPAATAHDDDRNGAGRQVPSLGDALIERAALDVAADTPGRRQLDRALRAVTAAGLPADPARLDRYAAAMSEIADAEIAGMPDEPAEMLAYAVLGTALYEPVLLALRRLAHEHHARRALDLGSTPHDARRRPLRRDRNQRPGDDAPADTATPRRAGSRSAR